MRHYQNFTKSAVRENETKLKKRSSKMPKKQQPQQIDLLANLTIACCAFVIIAVYVSIVILPPWDDGTGFPIFSSHFDTAENLEVSSPLLAQYHQRIKDELIPESAKLWASNLSVEINTGIDDDQTKNNKKEKFSVDVFDSRAELGRHHVMKISFCPSSDSSSSSFCVCNESTTNIKEKLTPLLWNQNPCVDVDQRILHEQKRSVPDRRETAIMVRILAQSQAEKIERESFDRLVIRLRYYYQTTAGVDALFHSIFSHGQVQVEEAPIEVRHSMWIVQPRLPPKKNKDQKLNFIVVEKDSRWVYDLAKDPQANALTHAPFVFPMFLILLSCVLRIVKGLVMMVKKN